MSRPASPVSPASASSPVLVVGAGGIGGTLAAALAAAGTPVVMVATNPEVARSLREHGYRTGPGSVVGAGARVKVRPSDVVEVVPGGATFETVFLATQPPQVEEATRTVLPALAPGGVVVCFQNGLCEERVARVVGPERVVGAVVAWGASMPEPGVYERTSRGGFTVGRLRGEPDAAVRRVADLLAAVGPVRLTGNLLGSRWSKLAINCAVSTLGTVGGDRMGALMRRRFVRRLAIEIMTETVEVARAEGVRLEKVSGTVDLERLALRDADRRARGGAGLVGKHLVLLLAGAKYRKLRSSMLAAIERGRPPAVDFLNGEVVTHGAAHGITAPVNRAAQALVWQIARGEAAPCLSSITRLYEETRVQ